MSKRNNNGLWEYLEATGVLEKGTDAEIKAAKLAFRKEYLLKYKQNQRNHKPEFTVNFSNTNGEFSKVEHAANRHKMTITAFIRSAVMSYLDQSYIVPNSEQIIHLEQILSECLNQIQSIVKTREKYHWERDQKFESIEKIIIRLEVRINQIFRNPPLAQNDCQSKIL
ncbi:MAG: hypothetical protein IPP56_14500 [Bacteroidetes bacterium]|nr:hypothetical protein [Bacteroidota bacterium]MBK9672757.1 hypothetical protein [Bacteroidota bacterium]MBK9800871.1 hypothetical protein [Bacteroidota bacterium]MBP6412016.1 hypothetical protein [Bacteroidia bacterium]